MLSARPSSGSFGAPGDGDRKLVLVAQLGFETIGGDQRIPPE
ncbi:MAG: hypothetical protein U5L46_12985 [Agrobacterium sp.]|nr:hypothetical protein [Agrobacterium sp.]